MKSLILYSTLISVIALSCSQPEKKMTQAEIVKRNAERYLFKRLNDTTKYQFVSLQLGDSVTYGDNLKRYKDIGADTTFEVSQVAFYKTMRDPANVSEYQAKIDKKRILIKKLDSIESTLSKRLNETAAYNYIFTFRASNKLGAIVLEDYYLQIGRRPDFEVLILANDKGQKLSIPGGFPGIDYLEKL